MARRSDYGRSSATRTQSLRNWLINAPRHKVNPNERLQIDSVSVLPPAGDHWVIEEAAARSRLLPKRWGPRRAVGTQWSRRQSSPPLSLAVAAFQLWSTSYNARGREVTRNLEVYPRET